jgi:hypothetical protein
MTRQDLYYVAVHVLAFILGYAVSMASLTQVSSAAIGWFSWLSLVQGLVAMGVTNLGSNITAGSGLSSTARFLHLSRRD